MVCNQGGMLLINFDILFTSLPCSVLSLDAMDVSGEVIDVFSSEYSLVVQGLNMLLVEQHELDVVRDVYKRQVGRDGILYGDIISQVKPSRYLQA
jgi:hypothetical protein